MKLRFSKKVWVALGVVVLLVAAAGIGFMLQQLQHKNDTPSTSNTGQQPLPASVSKVEELITAGKTEEAQQQITSALNSSSTSNEDKFLLYYSQANIASDKQDYNAVVDALLKAAAIKETSDVDARLANSYQQLGDKAKAIDYYKKAIQHETDDNPMRDREVETYQQMIRDLGGQP